MGARLEHDDDDEATQSGAGRTHVGAGRPDVGKGTDVADVSRELAVSEQTYYRWRNQFGGLKTDDAKRLKDLERENDAEAAAR